MLNSVRENNYFIMFRLLISHLQSYSS